MIYFLNKHKTGTYVTAMSSVLTLTKILWTIGTYLK